MNKSIFRELKVYESRGNKYDIIPTIRLKGKWLQALGFEAGTPLVVKCQDGKIEIVKAE